MATAVSTLRSHIRKPLSSKKIKTLGNMQTGITRALSSINFFFYHFYCIYWYSPHRANKKIKKCLNENKNGKHATLCYEIQ